MIVRPECRALFVCRRINIFRSGLEAVWSGRRRVAGFGGLRVGGPQAPQQECDGCGTQKSVAPWHGRYEEGEGWFRCFVQGYRRGGGHHINRTCLLWEEENISKLS
jgi:hypothetical protein